MAIVNCSKHGRSGASVACEHLDAEFSKGHNEHLKSIEFMLFCDGCWEEYDLARFEKVPDLFAQAIEGEDEDPLLVEFYRASEQKPFTSPHLWCEKCLAEIQANNAIGVQ